MARIIINGRFLTRPMTGVDRYAKEVVNAIDRLIGEKHPSAIQHTWELATPVGAADLPLTHIRQRTVSNLNGQSWEQLALPLHSMGSTLVNLCNAAPIFKRKQMVVVHDVATVRVPESYGRGFRLWYDIMIPAVMRLASHVGTVSEFSKRELQAIHGNRRSITVLPEGAEHLLGISADLGLLDQHDLRRRPYVLAVGSMAPHKNFKLLIDAVGLLSNPPFDVVIAGGTNPKVFSSGQAELPAWVKHVGYVTDNQLRGLFEHASCFVFPSRYEGYGLPPTEAMALGCPVICSRSASLPEVCGEAALYFDADSPHQLASELVRFSSDPEIGARLRSLGHENVRNRTWRNAALALINSLEKA